MKTILTIAALGLGLATQASAHVTFAESEAVQGQTARFTLRVPHGCSGEATLRVRVSIPDGLARAQPMVHAGWELETVTGPLAQPYTAHGTTYSEGIREIIWSGELPSEYYDEFVFRAAVTDQLPAGETVYIPVVQECANGTARWIEIPAQGQDPDDLADPAPGVMIVAPGAEDNGH